MDVQGRLSKCIAFWEDELKATWPVIDCLREGYNLPLLSVPGVYSKGNQRSALDNSEFVELVIEELLQNRCIRKVEVSPHVCSLLSVVSNSINKKRRVLD